MTWRLNNQEERYPGDPTSGILGHWHSPLTHHQHELLPPLPCCQHRHAGHCGPGQHSSLTARYLDCDCNIPLHLSYNLPTAFCDVESILLLTWAISVDIASVFSPSAVKRHRIPMHTSFGYIITQFNIESSLLDIHIPGVYLVSPPSPL